MGALGRTRFLNRLFVNRRKTNNFQTKNYGMCRKRRDFAFKPRTDIDLNPTTTQKGGRESVRITPNDERA